MDAWHVNMDNKTTDRIISLTPMEGHSVTSDKGLIDRRLFTGENRLHACMADDGCLWYLKYDSGILPGALRQQFTGFNKLMTFTTEYFKKRNVIAKEVTE